MYGITRNSDIEINGVRIKRKEYKGQAVVTLADIDSAHGRTAGTAGRNFRKNRKHFIEGEDFFILKLTDDEIRRQFGVGKNAGKTLILLTESGYLMIVKSFTDDLSWSVQRQLIQTYFKVSEITSYNNNLSVQVIEKLDLMEQKINALEKKVNTIDKKVDSHADNIVKTLFDMSSNVIAKGMQIIYDKLSK